MKSWRVGLVMLGLMLGLMLIWPPGANAQTGLYGMFSYSHISGQGVGYGVAGSQRGSTSPVGGTFGMYSDFLKFGPVHVGGDGRFFIQNSGGDRPFGSKASGALVGARIDAQGLPLPIQPYGQVELGVVGANNANSYTRSTGLAYQFQAGLDYVILPRLDLRFEYGAGQIAGGTGPSRALQQLGAGMCLRL
jgi:hypothetical protein